MTRIYTKTGDTGETSLFGGERVGKNDLRVSAYGDVDELNAVLGMARSAGLDAELDRWLQTLQEQLFTVGAILATPTDSKAMAAVPELDVQWISNMENAIDTFVKELPPLTHFILPGGCNGASALHLARTVCRRAERLVVSLHAEGRVPTVAVTYLNRLSDFLFTLARVQNRRTGQKDVLWLPPPKR